MINKTELKDHFIILLHSTRHLTNRQRDLGWGVQCPNLKFFIVSPIEQVPQTTTFSTTISAYSFLMQHLGQWSWGMHESLSNFNECTDNSWILCQCSFWFRSEMRLEFQSPTNSQAIRMTLVPESGIRLSPTLIHATARCILFLISSLSLWSKLHSQGNLQKEQLILPYSSRSLEAMMTDRRHTNKWSAEGSPFEQRVRMA